MKFILKGVLILLCFGYINVIESSRVLELSDRFLDVRKDGQWLVMFYAPWCAHCKRLEPIWAHVAQALHNTNIRVGRVDCTRFTGMATEFGIAGFPTILFLKGDAQHTFKGDRTKEEIVNFAVRLSGPPVQQLTKLESLETVQLTKPLFFLYIGEMIGNLWDAYLSIAEILQPHAFFYSVSTKLVDHHTHPVVAVYKEDEYYFFADSENFENIDSGQLNSSLYQWINTERFSTFPKVTRGNIHQIMMTNKYLVLAIVEENKLQEISPDMLEFRDMVESVIRKNRDKFHKYFQFGWIGSPELANSIAMSVLPLPHLLVINSTTNHHHIPEEEPRQMTIASVTAFLERIHNQSAPAYGGNTLVVRMYRTYFEARTSLAEMWQGNPVLTAVLFGLPLGFLSLICYSICCADIMDADEEEEDITHEKKE
ncbi:protein disulfide-isomerase TMX3 isoform X1 [Schistocerca piceifrons]|uniref:protein disulfide-isomerase TMX3 isoform X1 n=2 Tax=Schistocerca piceifrons TaxID=274613 RepID=UPI001F5EAB3F|nr:protein disulfide-isomerase TMX3 isoform X1 [Schistocerca piceifrons]